MITITIPEWAFWIFCILSTAAIVTNWRYVHYVKIYERICKQEKQQQPTGARGMTDTISDEARELLLAILARLGVIDCQINSVGLFEQEIGAVLTAARADERNKALQDAADVCPIYCGVPQGFTACHLISNAILAMKVQP